MVGADQHHPMPPTFAEGGNDGETPEIASFRAQRNQNMSCGKTFNHQVTRSDRIRELSSSCHSLITVQVYFRPCRSRRMAGWWPHRGKLFLSRLKWTDYSPEREQVALASICGLGALGEGQRTPGRKGHQPGQLARLLDPLLHLGPGRAPSRRSGDRVVLLQPLVQREWVLLGEQRHIGDAEFISMWLNTKPVPRTRVRSARHTSSVKPSSSTRAARASATRSSTFAAAARSWSQVLMRCTFSALLISGGT